MADELTMHHRFRHDGRISCGVRQGCVTAVVEDVTCKTCVLVAWRARALAADCGCAEAIQHLAVARAQIEIATEQAR